MRSQEHPGHPGSTRIDLVRRLMSNDNLLTKHMLSGMIASSYGTTHSGYRTTLVWCRGGTRYVEGCWGVRYLFVLIVYLFLVVICCLLPCVYFENKNMFKMLARGVSFFSTC